MYIFIQYIKGEMIPPIALRTKKSASVYLAEFCNEHLGEDHPIGLEDADAIDQINSRLIEREIFKYETTCI